jgi:F-type H+-transporting ATPase subunit a
MLILAPLLIPIEIISHWRVPLFAHHSSLCQHAGGREGHGGVSRPDLFRRSPAIFMGLHVFVSFLQAYIFVLMTMMYVNGAVAHEH